jgi:uncharacterized Zn-finger protein
MKEYPNIYTQHERCLPSSKPGPANSHERVSFDIIKQEMDVSELELDTPMIISNSPSQPQYRRTTLPKHKTGGGRGIRKRRQPAGSPNDTNKAQFLLRNGTVLTMDKPTTGKRHTCPYILPGPNGKYCDKKFQRSEHLKRHLLIHVGTDFHACPDPACSLRILSRADNMREHYKTHLQQPPSKRTQPRTFEEFFAFIRAKHPEEVAEKEIERLKAWKRAGKHLKLEDNAVAVGRASGNRNH